MGEAVGRTRVRWRTLPRRGSIITGLAIVSLFVAIIPTGASSFTGNIVNSLGSFSAGTLQAMGTTTTTTNCYSTGTGMGGTVSSNASLCTGDLYPTSVLSTTAATATSTLSDNGTTSPASASVALTSCGVEQVVDTGTGADTGLSYGGVTYGAPFTSATQSTFTDKGVTLNGNSTSTYIGTTKSVASTSAFSLVGWVNTTTLAGGVIMGMSASQTNLTTSTPNDESLFVNSSGDVVFNMENSSGTKYQAKSAAITANAWHFVVATFTSASGLKLYVDSQAVVSTALTSFDSYSGYWHIGWNPVSGWTGAPTNLTWNGSLYGLAVIPSVLSAANVTTLYNETSSSAYASAISGFAATDYWALNDTGTVPYTGTIPALAAAACPSVQISIQESNGSSTQCVFPSLGSACTTWAAVSTLTSQAITLAPTTSTPTSIVVSVKVTATPVAGAIYLHVLPDLTFTLTRSPWTAALTYYAGSVEL